MGHHIEAIITKQPVEIQKLNEFDLPLIHEAGFHIIPLDSCHTEFWGEKWGVYDEDGEHFGGINLICLNSIERLAKELGITVYALIGTDYHAGVGNQAARVYKDSNYVQLQHSSLNNEFGLIGTSINTALNEIGVIRQGGRDEFDTLNLGNYRNFESYFEKYSNEDAN